MQKLGKHRGVLGLPPLSIPLELQLRRQLSFSEDSDLSSDDILERSSQKSRREVCRVKLSPNLWVVLVGIPGQGGMSMASSDHPAGPQPNAHKGSASLGLFFNSWGLFVSMARVPMFLSWEEERRSCSKIHSIFSKPLASSICSFVLRIPMGSSIRQCPE